MGRYRVVVIEFERVVGRPVGFGVGDRLAVHPAGEIFGGALRAEYRPERLVFAPANCAIWGVLFVVVEVFGELRADDPPGSAAELHRLEVGGPVVVAVGVDGVAPVSEASLRRSSARESFVMPESQARPPRCLHLPLQTARERTGPHGHSPRTRCSRGSGSRRAAIGGGAFRSRTVGRASADPGGDGRYPSARAPGDSVRDHNGVSPAWGVRRSGRNSQPGGDADRGEPFEISGREASYRVRLAVVEEMSGGRDLEGERPSRRTSSRSGRRGRARGRRVRRSRAAAPVVPSTGRDPSVSPLISAIERRTTTSNTAPCTALQPSRTAHRSTCQWRYGRGCLPVAA